MNKKLIKCIKIFTMYKMLINMCNYENKFTDYFNII